MSSKPDKKKLEEKEPLRKQVKESSMRPSGRVPTATVMARHGSGMVSRAGKGYSLGELSQANIVPRLASMWGVRLDGRRRSVLEPNVASLKNWEAHAPKALLSGGEVKKVEAELVKVEKEVKKSAVQVKKEVVKIEAKAKKEAAKVERKVKKKAGKAPKARPKKKTKK